MVDPVRLLGALAFAAEKHSRQRRKDSEASPYINHPIAVATVLAAEAGVSDEAVLLAAVLHDTVEDTETTFEELERRFGRTVRDLVAEVTDDKSLPKQERKDLQVAHARAASAGARQIKIADKICNIRDIAESPPADWPLDRKREYLVWAERVVEGCRGVNPRLDAAFDGALSKARRVLRVEE
jgi:guanosine-3',5'-bis(diphosphate) 3'-pyrophosphohydrolase